MFITLHDQNEHKPWKMGLRAIRELATRGYDPVQFGLKWPIKEQEGGDRERSSSSEVSTAPLTPTHPVVPVVEEPPVVGLVAGEESVEAPPVVPVVEEQPVVEQVAEEETVRAPPMVLVIEKRRVKGPVAGEKPVKAPPVVPVEEEQPVRQQPARASATKKRKATHPPPERFVGRLG